MEAIILELQNLLLVEALHSEFAEKVDTVQFGVFLSESESVGTSEEHNISGLSRDVLSMMSVSSANACPPFPSFRRNVKELPKKK